MTSADDPDKPERDPADILADMANKEPDEIVPPEETDEEPDPMSALDLMAGDDVDAADELEAIDQFEPSVEAGDETDDEAMADFAGGGATPAAGARARQVRAAAFEGHQRRRHYARLYKKTMVPLLLVVGGLLILVGLLAGGMVIATADSERYTATHRYMIWVTVVSFPLSGVLFFGAWAFHRETSGR